MDPEQAHLALFATPRKPRASSGLSAAFPTNLGTTAVCGARVREFTESLDQTGTGLEQVVLSRHQWRERHATTAATKSIPSRCPMIPRWAQSILACPRCGAELHGFSQKARLVRCSVCGPYPVLSGVPILVPDAAFWCAQHFDAVLSSLAEFGLATARAVETVRAFAGTVAHAQPTAFSDDWTEHERTSASPPALISGPGSQALKALLEAAKDYEPARWLEKRVPRGVVVEVGCGAGSLSARLSKGRKVIASDTSLRAVLHASAKSSAVPVVADAQHLPFQSESIDGLVAQNVVDLLDDPAAFFSGSNRVLKATGALTLSTPEPSLGAVNDDSELTRLIEDAGLGVEEAADGLPWLRRNSQRFVEVWLVRVCLIRQRRRSSDFPP